MRVETTGLYRYFCLVGGNQSAHHEAMLELTKGNLPVRGYHFAHSGGGETAFYLAEDWVERYLAALKARGVELEIEQ